MSGAIRRSGDGWMLAGLPLRCGDSLQVELEGGGWLPARFELAWGPTGSRPVVHLPFRGCNPGTTALGMRCRWPATPAEHRATRQEQILDWAVDTFGAEVVYDIEERSLRLVEEAIEVAQACGVDPGRVLSLVRHVYARPEGELAQEIGGCGLTLEAVAEVAGIDASAAVDRELARVVSKPRAHFAARQNAKAEAGVALRVES